MYRLRVRQGVFVFFAVLISLINAQFAQSTWAEDTSFIPAPPEKHQMAADGSLSEKDITLYRQIFDAQKEGRFAAADRYMWKLSDMRLRGYILYQRYMHPTAYTSKFNELKNWLELYSNHPGADDIYNLAVKKAPSKDKAEDLQKPVKLAKIATRLEPTMVPKRPHHLQQKRSSEQARYSRNIERKVSSNLRRLRVTAALEMIREEEDKEKLPQSELDYYKAQIAEGYLYVGEMKKAYELAKEAYRGSGETVPLAGWVCGLISWHQNYFRDSARYFETAADSDYASGWVQSAASYWAARANMRAGNEGDVRKYLQKAAHHPRTFYGLLAIRSLKANFDFDWDKPSLTPAMLSTLTQHNGAARGMALLAVGERDLAEQELLHIKADDYDTRKALLAYALEYKLPALSLRLGSLFDRGNNRYYDTALYPDLDEDMRMSTRIDPDLIQAIARQESRFDTRAVSYSGARGLLQIMPKTAQYVAKKHGMQWQGLGKLADSKVNLALGQNYVRDLFRHPVVGDNIVSMLIAYNAGPGNLSRWKKSWSNVDDTLLFIELLPASQTREYVEKVLANYWIYRMKQGRDTPTLTALASGKVASYKMASSDLSYEIAMGK